LSKLEYTQRKILTVTELTEEIRQILEGGFSSVWVQGEISNYKRAPSGHSYFTLKDNNSQVRSVMFKGQSRFLKFKLEDGLKVLGWGRISVYSPRGEYQLVLETLEPVGLGSLMLALEQLKAKLSAEGLFEVSRKKKLPRTPKTVGVITSATGAAVRDIIRIIHRRSPGVNLVVSPTSVQGEKAPGEIIEALNRLVVSNLPDVIIIGRGGGSIEDLWAFNDETVVRSIGMCPVPIISAVGHETDFTLSDLVADVRASTPSAAAELVVPDDRETWDNVSHLVARLKNGIFNCLSRNVQTLDEITRTLLQPMRRIQDERIRLMDLSERIKKNTARIITLARKDLEAISVRLRPEILTRILEVASDDLKSVNGRLNRSIRIALEDSRNRLLGLVAQLEALSPLKVIMRGYSITFRVMDGALVQEAQSVSQGDEIRTLVSDGEIISVVKKAGQSKRETYDHIAETKSNG
jgi:exodeoxyribonuclease VII large subunit